MCWSGTLSAFIGIDEVVHGALRVHSLLVKLKQKSRIKAQEGKSSQSKVSYLGRQRSLSKKKGTYMGGTACSLSSLIAGSVFIRNGFL